MRENNAKRVKLMSAGTRNEHANVKIGSHGEWRVFVCLARSFGTENVFLNVRGSDEGNQFELDVVVLDEYGVLVVEVKTWGGAVRGNPGFANWTHFKSGQTKAIPSPLHTLENKLVFLRNVLGNSEVKLLPLVVFNNKLILDREIESDLRICKVNEVSRVARKVLRHHGKLMSKDDVAVLRVKLKNMASYVDIKALEEGGFRW
jgi:hypothetical protein